MIFLFLLCIAHMCSGQEVKHYSGSHIVKHEILLAPHLMTKKITLFPIHHISSTGHREPQLVQQILTLYLQNMKKFLMQNCLSKN